MQDKRKETERQQAQPGSMASYNNRQDNRQGRVEDTEENNDEVRQQGNNQPENKSGLKKKED